MPKERRKYKEYLWNDQLTVPKSTKYLKKKETTNSNINANNNRLSEMPIDNQEYPMIKFTLKFKMNHKVMTLFTTTKSKQLTISKRRLSMTKNK